MCLFDKNILANHERVGIKSTTYVQQRCIANEAKKANMDFSLLSSLAETMQSQIRFISRMLFLRTITESGLNK